MAYDRWDSDSQLRRLVRWLAAGMGTRTRALATSRFPLVDLDDWKHKPDAPASGEEERHLAGASGLCESAGYCEERLEDLEPAAARAVLRG